MGRAVAVALQLDVKDQMGLFAFSVVAHRDVVLHHLELNNDVHNDPMCPIPCSSHLPRNYSEPGNWLKRVAPLHLKLRSSLTT